jgi:peptidylprolyl isomerase
MKKHTPGIRDHHSIRPLHRILPLISVVAFIWLTGCKTSQLATVAEPEKVVMKTTESGLEYHIEALGSGPTATDGDVVSVHYSARLEDGTMFDNSYDRGEPIVFTLGIGQVIPGWEEGIKLLSKGDKATFNIPPQLAYGENSIGPIPPNATLTFEVELVDISNPVAPLDVTGILRQTTERGVEYAVVRQGQGIQLEPEMRLKVHYNGFLEDGTRFDSSYDRARPIEFVLGRGMVIPGWEEGLQQLRVGDQARIWIPYQLAYGENGRGPIPARANLIFDVEIMEAEPVATPKPFDVSGLEVHTTETGLMYIVVREGHGQLPEQGKVLIVHYSGFMEDGSLFDSSVQRGEPFRFVLGSNQVIRGWDEGFALMRKGSKMRFIIPPDLGYGDREVGPIPANSTLIFDVELIDFQQ